MPNAQFDPDFVEKIPAAPPQTVPTFKAMPSLAAEPAGTPNRHTLYSAEVTYYRVEGMHVYPVAGTATDGSQAGVLVQEHCPVERAIISWVATRLGKAPRAPSPVLSDKNFVLIDRGVNVGKAQLVPNCLTQEWALAGTYEYELIKPGALIRDFPGLPNPEDTTKKFTVPGTSFEAGLTL